SFRVLSFPKLDCLMFLVAVLSYFLIVVSRLLNEIYYCFLHRAPFRLSSTLFPYTTLFRSKAMLQSALSRLDVVSREEFETQQTVLLRTRERLEALEKRVAELESRP